MSLGVNSIQRFLIKSRNCVIRVNWKFRDDQEIKILADNKRFKDVHLGERCYIVGNGPSIKKQDLTLIKNEFVITVNRLTASPVYKEIASNLHIWSDPDLFSDRALIDAGILEMIMNTNTAGSNPLCFFPIKVKEQIEKFGIDKVLDVHYFKQGQSFYENYDRNFDLSQLLIGGSTVVLPAMMIAIYMGFTEINLIGCDCTGAKGFIDSYESNIGNTEYGFECDESKNKILKESTIGKYSTEYNFENYYLIFRDYRIIAEWCCKKNINVFNCTEGGILDTFPCRTLKNSLENNVTQSKQCKNVI